MATGARQLVRSLDAHDVDYVFGVCGDTSVGLYHTIEEMDPDFEHVLARDERSASYMADAYARLSGKPGVCEGPSGGGATYILPGLAEANDSAVPVIGLNTAVPVRYRGRGVLTELDQPALADAVTSWNRSVDHPDQVPAALRDAFRHATTGRPGATHLSLPMDTLSNESSGRVYAGAETTTYPAYRPPPEDGRVERAAELLAASERPVAVAGGGVHSSAAADRLRAFAERAGLPVAQTLTSVGCIGDSPYSIGVVGENGYREYANEMIGEADTLFLFGTAVESVWTDKWSRPGDGEKRIVHVDVDPSSIGKNYETVLPLPGDLRATLSALDDRYDTEGRKWGVDEIRARHEAWRRQYDDRFTSDEFPLRPERMVAGAREVLADGDVIVSDPGTSCPYLAAFYRFATTGRHWITPRAHGALGYAVPGVVGAQYARPNDRVIGFTGDGSLGMALGELETIARLGLPVTIVVVNNAAFSWIEAGQRNYEDFSFAVDFSSGELAALADELGLTGYRVRDADAYEATLRTAVESDEPALVDLPVQPLPAIDDVPVSWLEPDD